MVSDSDVQPGTLLRRRADGAWGIVTPHLDGTVAPDYCTVVLPEDLSGTNVRIVPRVMMNRLWERAVVLPGGGSSLGAVPTGRAVILADLEGITGVPNDEHAVTPAEETGGVRTPLYAAACRAMTLDVLMALAGVRAAGATDVVLADSHWYDTNLRDEDFDVPVVRGSQAALRAAQGAVAALLIGWHAQAGTPCACLPHTYTDRIARLCIDGQAMGEIGMLARLLAHHGTPVVLVCGDAAAVEELHHEGPALRTARTVVTKTVDDQGVAHHRPVDAARASIVVEAFRAIRDRANATTLPELAEHRPGRFEVTLQTGFDGLTDPEAERIGPATYRIQGTTILESYAAFQRFVDRLPAHGAAPLAR